MKVVYVADCDEWVIVDYHDVGRKYGFKTEQEARDFLKKPLAKVAFGRLMFSDPSFIVLP